MQFADPFCVIHNFTGATKRTPSFNAAILDWMEPKSSEFAQARPLPTPPYRVHTYTPKCRCSAANQKLLVTAVKLPPAWPALPMEGPPAPPAPPVPITSELLLLMEIRLTVPWPLA